MNEVKAQRKQNHGTLLPTEQGRSAQITNQRSMLTDYANNKEQTNALKEQTSGAEQFVNLANKHTQITELTPEILNTMIDKIIIGECESQHAKKGVKQKIRILFKGFGELDDLMCV